MDDHALLPIHRLMILTVGAAMSWLAVGGMAVGASRLIGQFF